eukprot:3932146-Rhodomonas_salina.3
MQSDRIGTQRRWVEALTWFSWPQLLLSDRYASSSDIISRALTRSLNKDNVLEAEPTERSEGGATGDVGKRFEKKMTGGYH